MNWKIVALLFGLVILSTMLMAPAVLTQLQLIVAADSTVKSTFNSTASFAIFVTATTAPGIAAVLVGHALETRVGMGTPILRHWVLPDEQRGAVPPRVLRRSAFLGLVLAVVIFALAFAFRERLPELPENLAVPPVWQGVLLMMGAAIREEIMFRYGAMNLLVWILHCTIGRKTESQTALAWTAVLITSIVFTAVHGLLLQSLLELSTTARLLGLLAVLGAGIMFGGIYWRYGLVAAIVCHASAGMAMILGVRGTMAMAD